MGVWLGTAGVGAEWAWRQVRDSARPNAGSGATSLAFTRRVCGPLPLAGKLERSANFLAVRPAPSSPISRP
eukprot:scaffold32940_cov44-Phaeocystis_antarctica.AAC.2